MVGDWYPFVRRNTKFCLSFVKLPFKSLDAAY
jgi:hypothetical protein